MKKIFGKQGLFFIILALQLCVTSFALADGDPRAEVLSLERQMEERMNPIVRAIDATAFVMVQVEPKKVQAGTLPGTPYAVKDMLIHNLEGSFEIESTVVTVFGKEKEKLEGALPLLKQFVTRFGAKSTINIDISQSAQNVEKEKVKAPTTDNTLTMVQQLSDQVSHFAAILQFGFWVLVGAGLLLGLLLIFGIGRTMRRLSASVEQGLTGIGSSIEAGGGSGGEKAVSSDFAKGSVSQYDSAAFAASTDFAEYSDETLIACLSDCYWGEFDSYAAFIWRRISIAKRNALIQKAPTVAPHLSEYVGFIADHAESDLGAINEPAYLHPLNISHLDNSYLTMLVRKKPELMIALPALRTKRLKLALTERLQMRQTAPKLIDLSSLDFSRDPKSSFRKIVRKVPIEVGTVADESELLNLVEAPIELIEEVPSLVWSMKLSAPELGNLLRDFSARDLALAWISPEEVLNRIATLLPPKKLELIQSNLKKIKPNRNSQSFKSLHQAIAAVLRARGATEEIADEAKNKAA